ncbi:MAG: helix-turn-helix transcriptional regulator [Candidatus Gastranaerophilales bacterium]|nr:helix-turn-helix transcriptional regulator [Candidatus Gastranaerophilales bacterium]
MSRLKLLGINIKKYREQKKLSQENLAEMVDLSREYIADIERGHKRISLKKLFLIADTLEVKCSDLINFN